MEGDGLLRRPRHSGLRLCVLFGKASDWTRVDFKYKGERDDRQFFPDFSSARVAAARLSEGGFWFALFTVSLGFATVTYGLHAPG